LIDDNPIYHNQGFIITGKIVFTLKMILLEPVGPLPDLIKFNPATFPESASVQLPDLASVNCSP